MSLIPQQFIDELMARVDIIDVLGARLDLRKTGREYLASCPFHTEKTPSFSISQEKQFYHCFGCGAHGTAISFLMNYEHMEFVEAVHELATHAGMEVPRGTGTAINQAPVHKDLRHILEQVSQFYLRQLQEHQAASKATKYMEKRGLGGTITKKFAIGFAPPDWDGLQRFFGNDAGIQDRLIKAGMLVRKENGRCHDRFRNRLMFPIHDHRGRVIAFGGRIIGNDTPKYLNSPETPLFNKGRELYGLYQVRQNNRELKRLLVVEGYMDVVSLAQYGIEYAVATLGTATSHHHLQRLFQLDAEIIFCFDGDAAGRKAAWHALELALTMMDEGRRVNFMFLPENEDPDSLIRQEGKESFNSRIVNSVPLSRFFYEHLAKHADLTSIDGRSRLVELARPMLVKIPPGVFRHMMIARLAEMVRMDVEKLSNLIQMVTNKPARARLRSGRLPHPSRPSLVRWALRLLLYQPGLAQQAGDTQLLRDLQIPGVTLLVGMIELLQNNPHYTCGVILEHWRNREEGVYLEKLVNWQPPVPSEGIEAEFLGALRRLTKQHNELRRQQLTAKPLAELSRKEKTELQQLYQAI